MLDCLAFGVLIVTMQLRTLLNKTKVRELTLRAELAALREEWLQSELANGSDGDDDRAEKVCYHDKA